MQVSCHPAETSAKITIVKEDKKSISWPEKNKKLVSAIFFTLGTLSTGITFFKAICLQVVPIVLSTLLSVALIILGIYYLKASFSGSSKAPSKLINLTNPISKINLTSTQTLAPGRKAFLSIRFEQLQSMMTQKKLENVKMHLWHNSQMTFVLNKTTFLVQCDWKNQMANVMTRNILSDEERKLAIIASNNSFANFLKLRLLSRNIARKEKSILMISQHVKRITAREYFKNSIALINFVLKLLNQLKLLDRIQDIST